MPINSFLYPGAKFTPAYEVANSLRFNDGSSDNLVRTNASATNNTKYTLSTCVKRSTLGTNQSLLYNWYDGSSHAYIFFATDDKLAIYDQLSGTDNKIPADKDVGDIKVKGLKTKLIEILKGQAAGILQETDWYVLRKADAATAIPSAITTHRAAVRTKCASMETAITNASDTAALETLYTYTEQEDGSITRPLGELPTLES